MHARALTLATVDPGPGYVGALVVEGGAFPWPVFRLGAWIYLYGASTLDERASRRGRPGSVHESEGARLTGRPGLTILAAMPGCARRATAVLLLGAALSPWLAAGMVAVHLGEHSADHHQEAQRDAAAVAVHGHHHEAGTPDHEHVLTLPVSPPAPARALLAPLPAALSRTIAMAAAASAGPAVGFGIAGPDPPPARPAPTILRI